MPAALRTSTFLTAMTAAILLAGCGDSAPPAASSNTEVTVKGVVKVDGAPASNGEVVFDPSNINRPNAAPRKGAIGKDGTYSVTTMVGMNEVKLVGEIAHANPNLQHKKLSYEVTNGDNTFDIDVNSK